MASAAYVIKEGNHIVVHLELILVQMDTVERNGVTQCQDGGVGTFLLCKESLGRYCNFFLGDLLVRESKEARSQSSAHHRFECLLLFTFTLKILVKAASHVPQKART